MAETSKGERIAKVIARAGLCSRRDAEAWIAAGRVSLDGRVLDSPAALVTDDSRIEVDGVPLPEAEAPRLWRYHKPRGELTTARDPQGRATVFDRLPAGLPRLQAVGRLDINSEGLLLMTNDGALKRQLELPSSGWLRRYRARVRGRVSPGRLAALAKGVTVEGVSYGPVEAALDHQTGANAWITIGLREGKNREVRKICAHLGLTVNRLIRVSYGPFVLGKLLNRAIEEVPVKRLREALGLEKKDKKKRGKGFAKAKPKANRPGSRKGFKKPERKEEAKDATAGKGRRKTVSKAAAKAKPTGTKKPVAKRSAAKPSVSKRSAAKQSAAKRPASGKAGAPKRPAKPAAKARATKPGAKASAPKKTARPSGKPTAKPTAKKDTRKRHANRRRPS